LAWLLDPVHSTSNQYVLSVLPRIGVIAYSTCPECGQGIANGFLTPARRTYLLACQLIAIARVRKRNDARKWSP